MILDISDLARAESMHQAETLKGLVLNGIMKPNEARARLDLAPIPGVADQLVSQMQVQPMQQNADLEQRRADREDKKVSAMKETADKKPEKDPIGEGNIDVNTDKPQAKPEDKPAPEEEKKIDLDTLSLILKGILK
jgi:phage portal protein BeeE